MVARSNLQTLFIGHLFSCWKANTLIGMGEAAAAVPGENSETLLQVASDLSSMSVDGLNWAGEYYRALALNRSQADRAQAEELLAGVAAHATPLYRAKALLALGSNRVNDPLQAEEYYTAAWGVNRGSLLVEFSILSMRAVLKSLAGDHRRALADLERLRPMADSVGRRIPFLAFYYLNNLAFFSYQAGDLDRAEGLAKLTKLSPVPHRIFDETVSEIAEAKVRQKNSRQGIPLEEKRRRCVRVLLNDPAPAVVNGMYEAVTRGGR